jgi:hypothetical protein
MNALRWSFKRSKRRSADLIPLLIGNRYAASNFAGLGKFSGDHCRERHGVRTISELFSHWISRDIAVSNGVKKISHLFLPTGVFNNPRQNATRTIINCQLCFEKR